ncbi:MAG: MoxR family ATPase [Acidobacteria bacterium]|nr:MoxR family ATPase [Acidobacteriota bacterium]
MRERASGVAESTVRTLEIAVSNIIRGKAEAIRLAVSCLLARGHLLIEDVPGVGKTTLAHALARAVSCDFHRLQCTSDMLPSDIVGVSIYNALTTEFEFKRGPVFTNFLLADEINRATPKTQSALLEAMNEGQVTVDGETHPLVAPFMVIATQNPAEHHGTYPLPESQLDRFLLRITLGYPDLASERSIIRQQDGATGSRAVPVLSRQELLDAQALVAQVAVDDALVDYALAIVARTRQHEVLSLGVSPRGAQGIYRVAQAMALVAGRDYVIPDDIKQVVIPVCAHRVMLNTRSTLSQRGAGAAERVIEGILSEVAVPL